ncbi:MAG: FtsQ-type POTRA domain-containing protein [Solobacterium sp.]|nr:FtsQ-type POTRA domain-containing protein [Solobacterium sp.]MCH4222427.1 FtsQ-type POTRA domain-containing protein [Solobacterium sp.]MCH4265299.1 FtsQ-type POTRA domain-containing protein [Solobacterium sp.]
MALEKDRTADDIANQPNGVELLLQKREIDRDNFSFLKSQPVLFALAVLSAMAILCFMYFGSSASNVQSISVVGCDYLDRSYIQGISGVTLDSKYYLTLPTSVASNVKKDPLVDDCKVEMRGSNVIEITITEKQPVGYRYEDDTAYILTTDGTKAELTSSYMSIISRVPYIVGFTDDSQTHLLTKGLADVSTTMISEIAEINQYSLNYDDEALEIQMRDGTYVFASYYNVKLLNSYHELITKTNTDNCLYMADSSAGNVIYSSVCPWNDTSTDLDYWTDSDGNYITNKYGDKVVKHYYTDSSGNQYLDDNGYPILIPIDSAGNEQTDADFKTNYDAGYYATGSLQYPETDETAEATATPEG